MNTNISPKIERILARPCIAADVAQEIDLLVRITVPEDPNGLRERPPLNVGLVIDRSGSMSGAKLSQAREIARACVAGLTSRDTLSVVAFDDEVQTIVPSGHVRDPRAINAAIDAIQAGGSTALFAGWMRGAEEVRRGLDGQGVNRVVLLTDGQANIGETNRQAFARQARLLAERGVESSTIGIGRDHEEDLLQSVAEGGGGTFWYAETAEDLPRVFEAEFGRVAAQMGRRVSLGLEPEPGVRVFGVLNGFDRISTGRVALPNLVLGTTLDVVVQLEITRLPEGHSRKLASVRLAWTPTEARSGDRSVIRKSVRVDVVPAADVAGQPDDFQVVKAAEFLRGAEARRRAVERMDEGDVDGAVRIVREALEQSRAALAACADEPEVAEHLSRLEALCDELLRRTDLVRARKRMRNDTHLAARSIRERGW